MGQLTIGRVGLDTILDDPSSWQEVRAFDDRSLIIRGFIRSGSYAQTDYLRRELLEQQGQLVACTYTADTHFDGYYILSSTKLETIPVSYRGRGIFPYEIELFRVGSVSRAELQSLVTGVDLENDHTITGDPFHSPPVGHLAYNAGSGTPVEITRTGEDGAMAVYLTVDPTVDPTWACEPSVYYQGAGEITVDGRLRAGIEVPNSPSYWEMNNSLVKVRATPYQGTSDGRFEIAWHNGTSWSSYIKWKILFTGTTAIPQWHFLSVLHNKPEYVSVRLIRDAATVPASAHRHILDLTLRRGSRFVSGLYTYTGGTGTHKIMRETTEAATAGTGFIKATALTDGNRWMLGSPKAFTADTTNGGITATAAAYSLPFVIGSAISDAADASGDGPADLMDQYIGWVAETVRAIWR